MESGAIPERRLGKEASVEDALEAMDKGEEEGRGSRQERSQRFL